VRLGIVEAQGEAFDVARCAIGFELLELGAAIPEFSRDARTVELDPGGGTGRRMGQGMLEALEMNLPGAELEVKIVLSIMCGRRGLNATL
jgi:hypothetical protein